MYVFELPSKREAGGTRVATIGSCRVRLPFSALRDLGELKVCDSGLSFTHGIDEARQALEIVLGARSVPACYSPYVHGTAKPPPTDRLRRTLAGGVDVFLVEVCGPKQIFCDDVFFQQHFVSRELVQPHRQALLPWYRRLAQAGEVEDAIVDDALEKLRETEQADMPLFERLLRHTRLARTDVVAIERALSAMMALAPGRWVVEGAMTSPGAAGAVMDDRRAMNAELRAVCRRCGALFFDPTDLVEAHGAATVFGNGGANIYEIDPGFYATAGRALLERIKAACPTYEAQAPTGASGLAERMNAELTQLHRRRLAEMGPEASGLFTHYEQLLDRNLWVGFRERAAFTAVDGHLPEYDTYAVVRAGLGELAFLLAASGRRVVAHEPNARRRDAIEAGLDHLEKAGLIEAGVMLVAPDLTPPIRPSGRVLGVALDAVEFREDAAAAADLDRAATFTDLLIDPRLFLRMREGWAEQDRLLRALAERGFGGRREYLLEGLTWLRGGG